MAIIMWPLGAFGFFVMLGDLHPATPPVQAWVSKGVYGGLPLTMAFAFLVAASWLSGYSYSEGKVRAIASLVLCSGFVMLVFWGAFLAPLFAL
jgi:hypothetical protein